MAHGVEFAPWKTTRQLRGFVGGIERDRAAVYAALTEGWPQGQTEGQTLRLKLIRRKMYRRERLDLLRRRVLATA